MKKLKLFLLTIVILAAGMFLYVLLKNNNENIIIQEEGQEEISQESENIKVFAPIANTKVSLPFIVQGEARVFEGTVNYQIKDIEANILREGFTTAAAKEMGEFGLFEIEINDFNTDLKNIVLEVFWYSPKDGEILDLVSIPLKLE